MSEEEFCQFYADNSKVTVKELKDGGLIANKCDCDEDGCHGWQMVTQEKIDIENFFNGKAKGIPVLKVSRHTEA